MRRQFIEVLVPLKGGASQKIRAAITASLLSPFYLLSARLRGAPGTQFHLRLVVAVARAFLSGRLSARTCFQYLFFPMDSTRYFEFDEMHKSAAARPFTRCLDVSSPRFAPLFLLGSMPGATVDFLNPDATDLAETCTLVGAMQLKARSGFFNGVVDRAPYPSPSFDLITCISVLEHIPEDRQALETMWSLLQPGGRLILTLPCMAQPMEQFISHNHFGVLAPGEDGYTFWQRFYDLQRLQDCIFSVVGAPARMVVYGEKQPGTFFRNATMKRLMGVRYPVWREPYMMATEWRYFDSIAELPGDGVVLLEFTKPAAA